MGNGPPQQGSELDSALGDATERINAQAWDRMARMAHPLAQPVREEELRDPLRVVDEVGWLGGDIRGWRVLCLAAAGGRHSILYASAGAEVTVVDISPGMLELDRQMAALRRIPLRLFQASMTSMPMLEAAEFDLVIHPVSTCYLADLGQVFHEVSRVLRPGGLYVSQHKHPMNLQASLLPVAGKYVIEHPSTAATCVSGVQGPSRLREPGTHEFVHSLDSLLGGICRAGMVIEDFVEPRHAQPDKPPGTFGHRCSFIPPYLRVKARKPTKGTAEHQASRRWIGAP